MELKFMIPTGGPGLSEEGWKFGLEVSTIIFYVVINVVLMPCILI